MVAIGRRREMRQDTGKCGGRGASRRVLNDPQAGRKHACMERGTGLDGLAAKDIDRIVAALAERSIPMREVRPAVADGCPSREPARSLIARPLTNKPV
jgi:hypothetical protein